ncbi:hypothetical protein [Actinoplanes utahensis]|uniref:DUF732 domain-containing protein n=1 Tax=Actinoplanes utahensis TaxID=1869 RepID=A0A0A6UH39_ACTUT|nr:hypothetical protein [Actinoplanes utahensis]KHD75335.1 hypothetical protein MB27_23080 [Actinoplanes utahensis]GIF33776.1 hypothetical protein Aut01nite_67620 [Actinoplanes utahensis]
MSGRSVIATVSLIALIILAGIGVVRVVNENETQQAQEKAAQLSTEFTNAGLRALNTDRVVNLLGDDGGAVCHDPDVALRRGILYGQFTNGAAGPGQRPVIVDNKVVQGQLLIIKVYCPEYIEMWQHLVNQLKYAEVAS